MTRHASTPLHISIVCTLGAAARPLTADEIATALRALGWRGDTATIAKMLPGMQRGDGDVRWVKGRMWEVRA